MAFNGGGPAVVKLGGSLIGEPKLDDLIAATVAAERPAVIVAGGGIFADAVRNAQQRIGFSDALAHRLAIGAMGAFASILAERNPRLRVASTRAAIKTALGAGMTPIFDGTEALHDPSVPATWEVTSDSIAAWLAAATRARLLIIVKSAQGIEQDNAVVLADRGIVDRAFPEFRRRYAGPLRCLGREAWPELGRLVAGASA